MSDNFAELTSLWNLLLREKIQIPLIQRDYAHGREGKPHIRRSFLSEIKAGLDADNKDDFLILDFVYGTEGGSQAADKTAIMYPLDGQQRVTTLWLIHWYLAWSTGELYKKWIDSNDKEYEIKNVLKNFSYELRTSSRDFCEALCDSMPPKSSPEIKDIDDVVSIIREQTWFYSSWEQDPTINSMLRMLKGDSGDDGIETMFKNNPNSSSYWDKLVNKDNIKFYALIIGNEKLPMTDDLYIKMNARGKPLSDFENFKADLVGWINSANNSDFDKFQNENIFKDGDNNPIPVNLKIASLFDNEWEDIFWKNAVKKWNIAEIKDQNNVKLSFDGKTDEIYFAFLSRLSLIEVCKRGDRETSKDFIYFYANNNADKESDDSKIAYEGFEPFKKIFSYDFLEKLRIIFENYSNSEGIEDWLESNKMNFFIPEYFYQDNNVLEIENNAGTIVKRIKKAEQEDRVYFCAITKYLEYGKFEAESLSRWMRVIRNLVRNSQIDSVETMITVLKKVEDLGSDSHSIYKRLLASEYDNFVPSSYFERQLYEEIHKAKKIYNIESETLSIYDGKLEEFNELTWEEVLKKAEEYSFFEGAVRFLIQDDQKINWDYFDRKWEFVKSSFSNDKDKPNENGLIKQQLSIDFANLFSSFSDMEKKLFLTDLGTDPREYCWKKDILCNEKLKKEVHLLLTEQENPAQKEDEYEAFLKSNVLTYAINHNLRKKFSFRCKDDRYIFCPERKRNLFEGVIVSGNGVVRNSILHKYTDEITVDNNNPDLNGIYWGIKISFVYKNENFVWWDDNDIYILDGNKEKINKRDLTDPNSNDDFIKIEAPDTTDGELLTLLDKLIEDLQSFNSSSQFSNLQS